MRQIAPEAKSAHRDRAIAEHINALWRDIYASLDAERRAYYIVLTRPTDLCPTAAEHIRVLAEDGLHLGRGIAADRERAFGLNVSTAVDSDAKIVSGRYTHV